jgi:hypothetical protein
MLIDVRWGDHLTSIMLYKVLETESFVPGKLKNL